MPMEPPLGPDPVMMTGSDPIELKLTDLLEILDVLRSGHHADELETLARDSDLRILAPAETVNAFKAYVASRADLRETDVGAKIMFPPAETMGGSTTRRRCCGFDSSG